MKIQRAGKRAKTNEMPRVGAGPGAKKLAMHPPGITPMKGAKIPVPKKPAKI